MFTTRPEISGTFGVAAATHWLAAQTAMGVLERGGNAFDAAVAGGMVLQVVEPHLNGPGGEVPIMVWSEKRGAASVIAGQGCAPQAATPAYFKERGMEQVPGIGLLAATVPGACGAWMRLLKDHGTWSLADVMSPAIELASQGFPVLPRVSQAIAAVKPLFETDWPSSGEQWLRQGRVPRPGSLMTNPALAQTYQRVVNEATQKSTEREAQIDAAVAVWYQGFVAQAIDAFCRTPVMDSSGQPQVGLLTGADMAAWQAEVETPLWHDFGRYRVAKCGPWSQGLVMLQQLGLVDATQLGACAPDSATFVHAIAEACKLAMADRLAWLGDPRFVSVPTDGLLSAAYLAQRRALIGDHASAVLRPGMPGGQAFVLPDLGVCERTLAVADTRYGVGEPTFAQLPPPADWASHELFVGDTCHINVIDRHGNMVAATPSGGWLSSSPTVPGLGFALNTRLQITWLDDGVPNVLAPGKRPCTTLSPTLVMRDGQPYMVMGTPGGDQQDQWQTAFFLRHAVHGMGLQAAIDAPMWHVDHFPASFWPHALKLNQLVVESRFAEADIQNLKDRGHEVRLGEPWSEGRLCVSTRERDSQGRLILRTAASPRGMQAFAVGR